MSIILETAGGRRPARDDDGVIDHPSGFLTLSPRNARFEDEAGAGFIAYREYGRHLVALGGVHAAPEARGTLLDRFVALAAARGRRPLVVQVRESQVPLFRSRGFTVNQLGTSFTLTLSGFSLRGTAKMRLRNKIARARHAGLRVVELGREAPRDAGAFRRLHAVSAAWLGDKGKKELDFMIGEVGEVDDARRRIFTTVDPAGAILGFITYVPAPGGRPGYLHDLTRRAPDAPPGTMELCNATAIERFTAEGVAYLHFGFTPFVVGGDEPPGANRLAAWAVRQLYRRGRLVYPAESQAQYKLKWGPDVLEREYLAARPLSLRAVVDLLRLTRSI
jgi:lysylphosphatidylglycerol synthetase-like protein (DUF2156 family)